MSTPTSPLLDEHVELGAHFTDFAGWRMPLRYGSELAEHHAVRHTAGLFDLSHMGEIAVRGPQAGAALDHREREPAEVGVVGLDVLGHAAVGVRRPLPHQLHGRQAVRHLGLVLAVVGAQEAVLERLEVDQLLEAHAGLDERRIGEASSRSSVPPVRSRRNAMPDSKNTKKNEKKPTSTGPKLSNADMSGEPCK